MKRNENILRTVALSALLTAMSVVIGFLCKTWFTFGAIRVTFENLPILLAGFAFGPFFGAAVGAASDVVSAVASGFAVNPLITVGAAAVGLTAGITRRYLFKGNGYPSILCASLIPHAVGSMLIKSVALYYMYGSLAMVLPRIPLYVCIAAAESYIIFILYKNRRIASALGGERTK